MDKAKISAMLNNPPDGKIGIAGDFCVDVYWDTAPEKGEKSIETGLMTTPVTQARYSPGGAGNIAANLRALGINRLPCFGAAGNEPFGQWLRKQLASDKRYDSALIEISRPEYHTPVYCKPLLNGSELSRIDLGNTPITDAEANQLLAELKNILPNLQVLVINEQIRFGIHTEHFRRGLAELIKEFSPQVKFIFDGRDFLDEYPLVTLKINAAAASVLAFGRSGYPPQESGRKIFERSGNPLVITDGEYGCCVFTDQTCTFIPAIHYDGPVDTVGAGDSFTAGFAYAVANGADLTSAAELGTCCSAVTIRKLNQTGVPYPNEILSILS